VAGSRMPAPSRSAVSRRRATATLAAMYGSNTVLAVPTSLPRTMRRRQQPGQQSVSRPGMSGNAPDGQDGNRRVRVGVAHIVAAANRAGRAAGRLLPGLSAVRHGLDRRPLLLSSASWGIAPAF
jgi:hypothetical protein